MNTVNQGLIAATLTLACALPARALAPEQVYAKVAPSVWRVVTYDADNLPLGQGSGVVVAPESIVTNCHVLAKARRVTVKREKESIDAKLHLWDAQRDVCQLKVAGLKAPAVTIGDSAQVAVGQSVLALGNPKGLELTMSAGLVSSLRRNSADQLILIQTSAAISGGSSGGGLFDDQGRLIGLTTIGSVTGDAQNLNFAIPSDWIRELPQRHARAVQGPAAATAAATVGTAGGQAVAAQTSVSRPAAVDNESYAAVSEVDKLPYANDRMRERYRYFLTRPLPRAFVISEGGDWHLASDSGSRDVRSMGTPAERALRECEQSHTGRCFVYAIDDQVVYRPDSATR